MSPSGVVWDRWQPMAKSEASVSMVMGRWGWKCFRTGAVVKDCCSCLKVAAACSVQVNLLLVLRVRSVMLCLEEV